MNLRAVLIARSLAIRWRVGRARRECGFSLTEISVVVAVAGILVAVAVMSVSSTEFAGTVSGFAEQIAAECEAARMRAVASRRWQRLEAAAGQVEVWQASDEGMAEPAQWVLIKTIAAPRDVQVASLSDRTHLVANDDVPDPGAGMHRTVSFAPDGSGEAATIFVHDVNDDRRSRVAIYGATGSPRVLRGW